MSDIAIELRDVSLSYRLMRQRGVSLKELLINAWRRQVEVSGFVALDQLTFDVRRGQVLGVVGPNGAGKSTLLKVIARVYPPTSGYVIVRGSSAPLIELGAGFSPELSGLENVVLYGCLLGRTSTEMRDRAPEIIRWAGLEEFRDVPLRAYSSGMAARLAFSVAVDGSPDVLLVDEVLSVGDAEFRAKSLSRMEELISGGAAVVMVSHDVEQLREYANEVVWLQKGRVVQHGSALEVTTAYEQAVRSNSLEGLET